MMRPSSFASTVMASVLFFYCLRKEVSRMIVSVRGLLRTIAAVTIALALVGGAAANTITGLGSSQGEIRAHGARGAFLSKWTIEKGSLRVLQGEDLIKKLYTWSGATWQL